MNVYLFDVFDADQINAHRGDGQADNDVAQVEQEELVLGRHNVPEADGGHCDEGEVEPVEKGPSLPGGEKNGTGKARE